MKPIERAVLGHLVRALNMAHVEFLELRTCTYTDGDGDSRIFYRLMRDGEEVGTVGFDDDTGAWTMRDEAGKVIDMS